MAQPPGPMMLRRDLSARRSGAMILRPAARTVRPRWIPSGSADRRPRWPAGRSGSLRAPQRTASARWPNGCARTAAISTHQPRSRTVGRDTWFSLSYPGFVEQPSMTCRSPNLSPGSSWLESKTNDAQSIGPSRIRRRQEGVCQRRNWPSENHTRHLLCPRGRKECRYHPSA